MQVWIGFHDSEMKMLMTRMMMTMMAMMRIMMRMMMRSSRRRMKIMITNMWLVVQVEFHDLMTERCWWKGRWWWCGGEGNDTIDEDFDDDCNLAACDASWVQVSWLGFLLQPVEPAFSQWALMMILIVMTIPIIIMMIIIPTISAIQPDEKPFRNGPW